jgi:uncharacterized protein
LHPRESKGSISDPMRTIICAVVLTWAASGTAQERSTLQAEPAVIVTSGDAVVRRTPDRAFVIIAIETRAKNPRDAQKQNADAATQVQQRLSLAKLGTDAIRTLGYHLEQEYEVVPAGRIPRDYVARNSIEMRIDDLSRVGELIDTVVRGGATTVAGVRFEIQNRAGAEQEALRLAVADARSRAEAAATGAGLIVDRVLRIEDRREDIISPQRPMRMELRMADATTPIEPGLIEIQAHVTLTVSIK